MASHTQHPRILIATGLYPPESGGPATFTRLAEEYLTEQGFTVTVVPFARVRTYPKIMRHIAYFFLLLKSVKNADIIFALDPISVGVPARCVASIKNKPFIVRLGGDYAWEQGRLRFGLTCRLDDFNKLKKVPTFVSMLRWLQSRIVRSADIVIAPSQYLKSIIASWGVPTEHIEVIYSVSDFNEIKDSSLTVDVSKIPATAHPVILSVSRLVPWKGFIALIDTVASLREKYPHIFLCIGGDGPQQPQLAEKILTEGLEQNVMLFGRVSPADLSAISKRADMFVLNTEYEGFSHLLVEFMQMKVPIITTDVGGNAELITDKVSGRLLPAGDSTALSDAIVQLTDDATVGKSYVEFASKRVAEFSEEASMARVHALLMRFYNERI